MNNIGIIGFGFVGKSIHSVIHTPTLILDINLNEHTLEDLINKTKIIFICLPTPTVNNICDDSLILDYLKKLKSYNGTIIVKSTIPLNSLQKILEINPNVIIWPEFLRENNSFYDIKNPNIIVVGTHNSNQNKIIQNFILNETNIVHTKNNESLIHFVSPKEASIFKYTVNSFLATKVVFMHQIFLWLKESNQEQSWDTISSLLALETRIGSSHLNVPGVHGFGFQGSCFPKDVQALISQAQSNGYELELLKDVQKNNNQLIDLNNQTNNTL